MYQILHLCLKLPYLKHLQMILYFLGKNNLQLIATLKIFKINYKIIGNKSNSYKILEYKQMF